MTSAIGLFFRVKDFEVLQKGTIRDALDELHRKRQQAWPTFQDDEDVADVINLRREDI